MAGGVAGAALASWAARDAMAQTVAPGKLAALKGGKSAVPGAQTMEKLTDYKDATSYNNFYEFGTDKGDPVKNAGTLKTRPWTVEIEGLVKKPGKYAHRGPDQAQRAGRAHLPPALRRGLVDGDPLGRLLAVRADQEGRAAGNAKYVEFVTLADPKTMPFVGSRVLDWPYAEGLRMDEAMHPLTLLTFGMYGEVLPNQNGAPVRLVVPWKYGFKSRQVDRQDPLRRERAEHRLEQGGCQRIRLLFQREPHVDHPRWSAGHRAPHRRRRRPVRQARKTLMFNGYEAQVGQLYAGMDLKKFY
jgi:sulfoxide reductase catalytic subunit YedY